MRVRAIADHANPHGRGRSKHKGDEYDMPAEDARAHIDAGLVERVQRKADTKT